MPRLPALLAAPAMAERLLWLTNGRVFDGSGAPLRATAGVLIDRGRIARICDSPERTPDDAIKIDLGGRTLLPGLIDAHTHVAGSGGRPEPPRGAEPMLPGTTAHFVGADLRRALRMGFTTMRDVGSYGDRVLEARQAMRYGAFRGPRLLTCGRIVSATSPGGRFFDGMYREADGPEEVRKAVREQLRRGADFIKLMTTGARSVELEDPEPAQMTRTEVATLVGEAHRMGYRVAAHAEGLAGTEMAIEEGVDTVEHGMYLHRRPDLLERMAARGQVLVPTLSCFYGVAGFLGSGEGIDAEPYPRTANSCWSPLLVDLAKRQLEEADRTLAAARSAGVRIAVGHDWNPIWNSAIEVVRLAHHGLGSRQALVAATGAAADALGLDDSLGIVEAGKLADLVVIDGDPTEDPRLLLDPHRIWLVIQLGAPVAGAALENDVLANRPSRVRK
jgi:imidazolonepropionase-like amidohydrolase